VSDGVSDVVLNESTVGVLIFGGENILNDAAFLAAFSSVSLIYS
jgi:hypothetical protein